MRECKEEQEERKELHDVWRGEEEDGRKDGDL